MDQGRHTGLLLPLWRPGQPERNAAGYLPVWRLKVLKFVCPYPDYRKDFFRLFLLISVHILFEATGSLAGGPPPMGSGDFSYFVPYCSILSHFPCPRGQLTVLVAHQPDPNQSRHAGLPLQGGVDDVEDLPTVLPYSYSEDRLCKLARAEDQQMAGESRRGEPSLVCLYKLNRRGARPSSPIPVDSAET